MRSWATIATVATVATVATLTAGSPAAIAGPEPTPGAQIFWERAIDPHGAERNAIVANCRRIHQQVQEFDQQSRRQPTTVRARRERARILADARAMLRYGLSREPNHKELLLGAGAILAISGHTTDAIASLERVLRLEPSARLARVELALLYTRTGALGKAIDHLRAVVEPATASNAASASSLVGKAALTLASLYMAAGRNADAIAMLASRRSPSYMRQTEPLAQLTLAVAYDRDGQLAKAHDELEKLVKLGRPVELLLRRNRDLAELPMATPLDHHYFYALLYEIDGMLEEAHAEWMLYAAGGPDARFRGRALEHAREIGVLLRAKPAAPVKGAAQP